MIAAEVSSQEVSMPRTVVISNDYRWILRERPALNKRPGIRLPGETP
jgi:hypothetical protein